MTVGFNTMSYVYGLCQTVATANPAPTSIAFDPNVVAFYGSPSEIYAPQFAITVSNIGAETSEPEYLGALTLKETLRVSGIIFGAIGDVTPSNQETLASFLQTLYEALSTEVKNDPSLGGIAIHSWPAGYEMEWIPAENGLALQINYSLYVEALTS